MEKRKKKGFTLIEMIVVLAIIAILAGIAVPQVLKNINNSKKTADIATAKIIAGAMQQALAEGKTITEADSAWALVSGIHNQTEGNGKIDLTKYIDNYDATNGLKPKMNSNYNFYYKYDIETNTLKIGAGTDNAHVYILYPTVNNNYSQTPPTTGDN